MQTLVALAALRCTRDDDAVANLHASHLRANGFYDAEAAVVGDLGAPNRIGTERAAHDRVTRRDGLRADDDLPGINRQEPKLLDVDRRRMTDETAERSPGLRPSTHTWGLRVQHCAAAKRGGTRLQETTT